MPVVPARSSFRIAPLDAARGIAMLAVCISHFGLGIRNSERGIADTLWLIGMIASPTFIIVSGAVLGYLVSVRAGSLQSLRVQLIDRGLFLLTIAHLAIDGAHYQRFHTLANIAQTLFMTDTIGIALILGILIVPVTTIRTRWAIAASLYVLAWITVLFWHPAAIGLQLLKEVIVGSTNQYTDIRQNFPVMEWLAVYLAATGFGQTIAEARTSGSLEAIGRRLIMMGPRWIVAAVAIKGVYFGLRPAIWRTYDEMPPMWRDIYDLTTPFDKYPPGPTYLLAYGGLSLILIGSVLIASDRGWAKRVLEAAEVVGRASLFVFVAEFYVYYLLVPLLPIPSRWVLVPYFIVSVLGLWILAWLWGRMKGNRFLTVGLRAQFNRRASLREPAPGAVTTGP